MQLEIQQVCKTYGKKEVLHSVNTTFQEGIYGILGPNGAGKTTLLKLITGIEETTTGEILWNQRSIKVQKKEYLDELGYSPQYPEFYKNFTVLEFLNYMCVLKKIPKSERRIRCENVLGLVNLLEEKQKKIKELSGGMRQRLSIAQTVLNNPKLVIFDEPTAGLDPAERIRFRNIIGKIAPGRIILITTHIVSDVEYIADEVMILKNGYLMEKDKIPNLLKRLEDKVWEVECKMEEIAFYSTHYMVREIQIKENMGYLRVISSKQPCKTAHSISPQLEDVFLDIYEKEITC